QDDSGYLLERYMLHADVHLGETTRFFVQLKSGIETGRLGGPRPPDEDKLDVNQAFVDFKFDLGDGRSLTVRGGRQEMAFGSSRLVSFREGPNVRQSFDGVRVFALVGAWRVDGFVTKPVETDLGVFDDAPDHTRTFWGVYTTGPFSPLPGGHVD